MMITGDRAGIAAHDTSFLHRDSKPGSIHFCFYKWIQLPKYENCQIKSANLEIVVPLTVTNLIIVREAQ